MKRALTLILLCVLTPLAFSQNLKFSQLPVGAPAQGNDIIPIARSGSNYSLKVSDIQNWMQFLPLAGGTLTGQLNAPSVFTTTTVTSPQFCIGSSCITTWPSGNILSVFGRTGTVTAQSGDYTYSQVGADAAGSAAGVQTNLNTEVSRAEAAEATKAIDSTVVHLSGTETVTGQKTFSNSVYLSGLSNGCLNITAGLVGSTSCGAYWANILGGTNNNSLLMGNGGSLSYTGSGLVDSNSLLHSALPILSTGLLEWTGAAWAFASPTGIGTVTSVGIQGTANQISVGGTCTITTSGICSLSLPSSLVVSNITASLFSGPLTGTASNASGLLGNSLPSLSNGYLEWTGAAWAFGTPTGTGTVTSFSAGNLNPLFTTSVATGTSTPALSFSLSNAAAMTLFGNPSSSSGTPSYGFTVGSGNNMIPQLNGSGLLLSSEIPNNSANTTGTSGGLSANIAESQVTNLTTDLASKQATLTGTGVTRNTGASSEISGDCSTSGSNAITCTKTNGSAFAASATSTTAGTGLNGTAIPVSKTIVGTDGSGHIVDASSATLANNTTGTAAALTNAPSLCPAGNAPTGILANGNATGCQAVGGGSGTGNVTGPSSSTTNDVAAFGNTAGTLLEDTSIPYTTIATLSGTQSLTNKTLDGVTAATMAFLDATSSIQTQLNGKVPTSTQVNGHALTANVTVGAADIPAGTFATGMKGVTQAANDSTTDIATDQFVLGQASNVTPNMDGTGAIGTSGLYARADHVHPSDTTKISGASIAATQIVVGTGPNTATSYTGATLDSSGNAGFNSVNITGTGVYDQFVEQSAPSSPPSTGNWYEWLDSTLHVPSFENSFGNIFVSVDPQAVTAGLCFNGLSSGGIFSTVNCGGLAPLTSKTSAYTLTSADFAAGTAFYTTGSSAVTYTLPATVPSTGSVWIENLATASVTISETSGPTLNGQTGSNAITLPVSTTAPANIAGALVTVVSGGYLVQTINAATGLPTESNNNVLLGCSGAWGTSALPNASGGSSALTFNTSTCGFGQIQHVDTGEPVGTGKTAGYTVGAGDDQSVLLTSSSASSTIAYALPSPTGGSGNFRAGYMVSIFNNSTYVDTITTSGSTIYGQASIYPGAAVRLMSDGTNWYSLPYNTTPPPGTTTSFLAMGPNSTVMTANMVIFGPTPLPQAVNVPTNGTNSYGTSQFILGTLPTSSWTGTIKKIAGTTAGCTGTVTSLGTVGIATTGAQTWSLTSTNFAVGDCIEVLAPASVDTTAANPTLSLVVVK